MTPERVTFYAEIALANAYADADSFADAASAITQAVNEALEEAAKAAKERAQRSFLTDDIYMEGWYDCAEEIANAMNALKLPEEP